MQFDMRTGRTYLSVKLETGDADLRPLPTARLGISQKHVGESQSLSGGMLDLN